MEIVQTLTRQIMEQRKWPLSRVAEELGEPIIRYSKLRRIMAGESANIDALLLVELFKLAGQSMDRVFGIDGAAAVEPALPPETAQKAVRLMEVLGKIHDMLQQSGETDVIKEEDDKLIASLRATHARIDMVERDALTDNAKILRDIAADSGEEEEEKGA